MGPFRHFYFGDFMLTGREEEEDAEDGADLSALKRPSRLSMMRVA